MIEDMARNAYLPNPTDDSNEPILFSDNEINLDDFSKVDEKLRKEMTRGQKEPQEECYSTQDTDPASTRNWVHKTTSSKPKEERLDWWNEPVEGEREIFNDQAMALWLYDPEDDESRENGEEDEVNRALVTMKNAVEDLEPPHTSSDQSRGEGGRSFLGQPKEASDNEVFTVPHRFRSEPVGTGWILIRNLEVENLPN